MEFLNLKQAAEHVHVEANVLKHAAQRGEVAAQERSGDWFFRHVELDAWAQRYLLAANDRERTRVHRDILDAHRRAHRPVALVADLFRASACDLSLAGKSRAGVLRDLTDLAARTSLVYDPEELFRSLKAREEAAPTAIGAGAAFPHPIANDPYRFEESFVAYARAANAVYFGAPDGAPTRHFFLVCATDHDEHLRILARLAVMAHATEFLELLDEAEDADRALAIIRAAEEGFLAS